MEAGGCGTTEPISSSLRARPELRLRPGACILVMNQAKRHGRLLGTSPQFTALRTRRDDVEAGQDAGVARPKPGRRGAAEGWLMDAAGPRRLA